VVGKAERGWKGGVVGSEEGEVVVESSKYDCRKRIIVEREKR
jgi:hypothetical protein